MMQSELPTGILPEKKKYYQRKRRERPEMIVVPEHQWGKLIYEAMKAGYSKTSIAAATGLSRDRIDSLTSGRTTIPQWDHGDRLLKLIYRLRQEKERKEENESE